MPKLTLSELLEWNEESIRVTEKATAQIQAF